MLRCLIYSLNYLFVASFVIFMAGARYFPRPVDRLVGVPVCKTAPDESHVVEMTFAPKEGRYERPVRLLSSTDWRDIEKSENCFSLALDRVVLSESDMVRIGRLSLLRRICFEKCFILTDIAHANLENHWLELEAAIEQECGEESHPFFDSPLCSKRTTDLLIRMQVESIELETAFFPVDRDRFAKNQRLYQLLSR